MKSVKYELGLQQVLFPNVAVDFSVYYSDIRDLLSQEIKQTYEGFRFAQFVNQDYGNIKGFIVTLDKRFADEEKQKPQQERSEMGLLERLRFIAENTFERITYTEAIEILRNSKPNKKKKFQFLIEGWGADLQSEHERFLVEKHFKKPVILYNYPKDIKAFYMRLNEDDKTVGAMDVLFPGIGEIIGGSQREERHDVLQERIKEFGIDPEELWWYLDTRRFGTAPHSGFGLGFERMVQFVTGMHNIRDVIPFPRTPGNAEF
jgi:asparaginyl-tRNA synthetase